MITIFIAFVVTTMMRVVSIANSEVVTETFTMEVERSQRWRSGGLPVFPKSVIGLGDMPP